MLFFDHVGQNVRADLPKLRRHLPPTGRDPQILQIQLVDFWNSKQIFDGGLELAVLHVFLRH